ncbi:hypothetical protein AGMMS49936_10240 [Endomicrobiia bacterium]|nr:hypothetical protein AGMMS49936_10240 [Endomicrobiia bacterium]
MKTTKCLSKLAGKMVRNVLAIVAMFACTSICLGGSTTTINSDLTYDGGDGQRLVPPVAGNSDKPNGTMNEDLQVGARKGKIGPFYVFSKNELDIRPPIYEAIMSTTIGVGTVMEVAGKELTLGAFGEYVNDDRIFNSIAKISSKGVGLLAKYDLSKDESGRRKIYGELLLKARQMVYSPKYEYFSFAGYGKYAFASVGVGGGCKYKINQNIELDGSIRYALDYHDKMDMTDPDKGMLCKCESRADNKISAKVKMNFPKVWKIQLQPYSGIGYEYVLEGKIKGTTHNGDKLSAITEAGYQGGAGILILGASAKIWKFDVDLSEQGYRGKRARVAMALKVKYTF